MTRTAILVCLAVAACNTDPPKICAGAEIPAAPQQRNPQTGACQAIDNYCGCDPCAGPCDPCGIDEGILPECTGACDALGESACLATKGCHAAYLDILSPGSGSDVTSFWGCWDIAPLPVLEGGTCTGFDPLTCIQHDDCTSTYSDTRASASDISFASCGPNTSGPPPAACSTLTTEAACTARTDCEPVYVGSQCTCDPSTCTCAVETFDHCQTP